MIGLENENERFLHLLKMAERASPETPVVVGVDGEGDHYFSAQEIKDILMTALFETPPLRKSLDDKNKQVTGETVFAEPPKWEYMMLRIHKNFCIDYLNQLGNERWEIISMDIDNEFCLLKRPK